MRRLFIAWILMISVVAAWTFAPASPPPPMPRGDGRAFGTGENFLVEGRSLQRQSAFTALDRPWGGRCAGEDRKQFISGLNEYYYHRRIKWSAIPKVSGKQVPITLQSGGRLRTTSGSIV